MKNKLFVISALLGVSLVFVLLYFLNPPATPAKKPEQNFSMVPTYRSHNQSYGNQSGGVVVVEFFDPECEACRQVHPIMKQLIKEYGDRVKFVFRYMPLHGEGAMYASVALEEAREMGKYEEALDILFERQPIWGDHHSPRPELVPGFLQEIGMPKDKLDKDYLLKKHSAKVTLDLEDGKALGVRFTPTIFVNGAVLQEIRGSAIRQALDEALKGG